MLLLPNRPYAIARGIAYIAATQEAALMNWPAPLCRAVAGAVVTELLAGGLLDF